MEENKDVPGVEAKEKKQQEQFQRRLANILAILQMLQSRQRKFKSIIDRQPHVQAMRAEEVKFLNAQDEFVHNPISIPTYTKIVKTVLAITSHILEIYTMDAVLADPSVALKNTAIFPAGIFDRLSVAQPAIQDHIASGFNCEAYAKSIICTMMAVHDDCHRPTRRDADGNLDVSDVLPDEEKALEQGVAIAIEEEVDQQQREMLQGVLLYDRLYHSYYFTQERNRKRKRREPRINLKPLRILGSC